MCNPVSANLFVPCANSRFSDPLAVLLSLSTGSPSLLGWIQHRQLYSSEAAEIVHGINYTQNPSMSEIACLGHVVRQAGVESSKFLKSKRRFGL
jgi:hypothetical protein